MDPNGMSQAAARAFAWYVNLFSYQEVMSKKEMKGFTLQAAFDPKIILLGSLFTEI